MDWSIENGFKENIYVAIAVILKGGTVTLDSYWGGSDIAEKWTDFKHTSR